MTMTKQDPNRQRMLDQNALAHLDSDNPAQAARYRAEVTLRGARRVLVSIPSYEQIDATYLQGNGAKGARSFAPPSKASLSSAANVAVAAAIVEAKVHALQDILKQEAAAITMVERAQSELEEARANLEAVLAKQPVADAVVKAPDVCADFLARARDPYAAFRPKRN